MLGRRVAAGWNGMLGCLWKRNCQGATQAMEEENVAQLFERIRGQEKAPPVFDRELKMRHRELSARLLPLSESLLSTLSANIVDKILDAQREFPDVVVLGGHGQFVAEEILKVTGRFQQVTFIDSSQAMLDRIKRVEDEHLKSGKSTPKMTYMLGDEEAIPIVRKSTDLIISCMGMHWVNDLPGALVQCLLALKPDGLFLGSMYGGTTLQELRISFSLTEQERDGGVSPRVSPFVKVHDAASLLSGAGFNLIGVDVDDVVVKYKNAWELIQHLRVMGESGASVQGRRSMSRDVALAVGAVYDGMFAEEDGSVPATYQVINMTGWAPHPSQQKPSRRGSATHSLQDLDQATADLGVKYINVDD